MTKVLKDIIVSYEDQRGPVQGFGPHRLIISCVADRAIAERLDIERALRDFRPMKGSSNLLRSCREDAADITRDGRSLVAIFDDDRIRPLLHIPKDATDESVGAKIRGGSTAPELIYPMVLKDNIETLVRDIGRCDRSINVDRIQQALNKKLNARDLVFREAAKEVNRHVRECVLRTNSSLSSIIDLICRLLLGDSPL